MGFDWFSLKARINDAIEESAKAIAVGVEAAKEVGTKAAKDGLDVAQRLAAEASEKVLLSDMSADAKKVLIQTLDSATVACDKAKEQLNKQEIVMEHKILMMGGRRAGKSTILSSILSQLREETPGDICTIIDRTDYTQQIETKSGPIPLPTLDIKQAEIRRYISKRRMNTEFIVDMSATYGKASYILEVSANNTSVELEFIDVPGEWMRANVPEHQQLVSFVKQSDVFIIAIDTPFLMNTDNDEGQCVNKVYNRINEITQAMANLKIHSESDKKQIILCPVKCEKWIQEQKVETLVKKVTTAYKDLINRWVDCPEVTIQIMPIQTVGGMYASRMLPAMLYFPDDEERTGMSCSEDSLTGMLMDKEGKVIRRKEGDRLETDKNFEIDFTDIPLSWYKLNGKGYSPAYCEQPGFHVLKFLVEKEEFVIKSRAEAERKELEDSNVLWRWFKTIFNPTFGKYLPVWREVINKLNAKRLIKTDGDGFCYVEQKVN